MEKYCIKCGAELQDEAKFCKKCGSVLKTSPQEINRTTGNEEENRMQTIYEYYKSKVSGRQYKKLPNSLNSMGLVIVILIWVAGLCYYVHMFEMSDKSGRLWFAASYIIVYGFLIIKSELLDCGVKQILDYTKSKTIFCVNVLEHFIIVVSAQAVLTVIVLVKCGKFHMEYTEDIDIFFFFPIIQAIVFLVTFILGKIIGDNHFEKKLQEVYEITRYNNGINNELEQWERDKKRFEKISEIQDLKIIDYMNKAIILLNENSNYEDALANVRRGLEYYLYKKIEADDVILNNENDMNIWGIIQYYNYIYDGNDLVINLNEIRKMCNNAVHVLNDGKNEFAKEECSRCISKMLGVLSEEYMIFNKSKEQLEAINKNIELYERRVVQHISNGNWDDALLNIRKTLESVVSGYVKAFHIICLYGHEKNLKGYIDVLNEKNIISNISKENMHKIRMSCNESAHTNNTIESAKTIEGLNNILKKEIKIYFQKKDSESTEKAILDKLNSEDDYIYHDLSIENLEDDYENDYEDDYGYENSNENIYANNQEEDYEDIYEDDYEDDYGCENYRYRDQRHYNDPFIQTDPYLDNPWGMESIYDHDGFDED